MKHFLLFAALTFSLTGCTLPFLKDQGYGKKTEHAEFTKPLTANTLLANPTTKDDTIRLYLETAAQMEKTKPDQAIAFYDKARTEDPRLAPVIARKLALLYDVTDHFDKALVEYGLALQAAPKDADLWNDLGYGYYNRGNWQKSEECLRKAIAFNSKHPRAFTNLGMALAQQERDQESLAVFQNSLPRAQALCNLAFIQASQGRKEQAKSSYLQALQLEPGLQLAQNALRKLDVPVDTTRPVPIGKKSAPIVRVDSTEEAEAALALSRHIRTPHEQTQRAEIDYVETSPAPRPKKTVRPTPPPVAEDEEFPEETPEPVLIDPRIRTAMALIPTRMRMEESEDE